MVFKVFTTAGNQRQCYAHGVAATSCCKSKYVDFIASIQVEWHTTILQPKEMMNINVEKMSWALIALMSALTDKYNYVNIYAYVCMVCETFLLQQSFQIYINILYIENIRVKIILNWLRLKLPIQSAFFPISFQCNFFSNKGNNCKITLFIETNQIFKDIYLHNYEIV